MKIMMGDRLNSSHSISMEYYYKKKGDLYLVLDKACSTVIYLLQFFVFQGSVLDKIFYDISRIRMTGLVKCVF